MVSIVLLLVFLTIIFAALSVRSFRDVRKTKLYRLLGQYEDEEDSFELHLPKLKVVERVEQWLLRAGVSMPVYRFLGYVAITMGGFFTFGLLWTYKLTTAFIMGFLGLGVVFLWLRQQSGKRQKAFEAQMESIVAVMSSSLRAGSSLAQTVEDAAVELDEPAASEFLIASHEIEMGLPAAEALYRLSDRVSSEDMHMLATAARVHSRSGGNLAEIMDNLGDTVRDRKALRSALKAYTAEGRLSGIVIGLIPIGVVAILSVINPGYFAPMLSNPGGRLVLILSFVMIFVGWIIIRQITQNMDF